jgi:nucleoside-diphosphate-sugar epimerase
MDVLIIGGTGLISTAITHDLVDAGHETTVYNRGETDRRLPDSVGKIRGDRTNHDTFEATMTEACPFDCVIDMVCYDPADAKSAVRAFASQVKQYILCSTVDVYARPADRQPVTEDAPRRPAFNNYGAAKADCENVIAAANDRGDFQATVIRPGSTYGEGSGLVHTFAWEGTFVPRIRAGDPIVVHSDGNSVWPYCHRDDVARTFVAAVGNEQTYGEIYHVTGEEGRTWNQYYRTVAQALDAPDPDLIHIPTDLLAEVANERCRALQEHFRLTPTFDNAKARKDLEFEYTVPWEQGIRRTVAWMDNNESYACESQEPSDDRIIEAWQACSRDFTAAVDD